ncbi:MAG TPA: hypothetical protein VJ283_05250, partial [Trebonia sp.]|nr:hypothetical protein [Trebonia sp.]
MLAKEGCGRTARVVGMTNASHPTVTEGEEGNDCTDAADLDPRPPVHRLDLGFGDRRREAATGQNSMAGSGNGG